jgi:phytoene dehydrogenase-like protein
LGLVKKEGKLMNAKTNTKKVIVIGAGIAGLSAGYYASLNGFNTEIYEMHNIPGGLCTSWKRKGYTIDGSLHWLTGSSPKSNFYSLWQELNVFEEKDIKNFDEFFRMEKNGETLIFYTDIDKLEAQFNSLSPEDSRQTTELMNDIRKIAQFKLPVAKPIDLFNIFEIIRFVSSMKPFMKMLTQYNSITLGEYSKKFKHPLIRGALQTVIPKDYPVTSLLYTISGFIYNDNGKYLKTSLDFSRRIAEGFEKNNGKITYNSRVKEIIVEDKKAVGVILENGEKKYADYIISACDGYHTLYQLLNKKYLNKKTDILMNQATTFSGIQVTLGVDCELKEYPHWICTALDEKTNISGADIDYLSLHIYNYTTAMAPQGKTLITTLIYPVGNYWDKFDRESQVYKDEKKKIADFVTSRLEKRIPAVKGKIEMIDVATPLTYTRYTNVYKGSYMGWYTVPPQFSFAGFPNRYKELKNFQIVGQWTQRNGGVPTGVMTGRWAVQRLCRQEKRAFVPKK